VQHLSFRYTERRGPWKRLEDVEFATLEWIAWFNTIRLLEPLGYVPPNEYERAYDDRQAALREIAALASRALRKTRGGSGSSGVRL